MRKLLKIMALVFGAILLAVLALFVFRLVSQNGAEQARVITSANGIMESYALEVRGRDQWIEIRGQDIENPVILMVHGGPGAAMRPWGYTFQTSWEEHFTIVHWDQRCGGKTYTMNREQGCGALTIDELAADGEVVIRYMLERLGKEKLVIVAHSWGSILGLEIASKHPELLYAYVGSGQIVDSREAQRIGFEWTLEQARKAENEDAIRELEELQPYDPQTSWGKHWGWLAHFGGENYTHRNEFYMVWKFFLSPTVSLAEMQDWLDGNAISNRELRAEEHQFRAADAIGFEFEVPIFFFVGRHDYNTPFPLARGYLEDIRAPEKALVIFENSAHSPQWEEPRHYLEKLQQHILPLIEKGGL